MNTQGWQKQLELATYPLPDFREPKKRDQYRYAKRKLMKALLNKR